MFYFLIVMVVCEIVFIYYVTAQPEFYLDSRSSAIIPVAVWVTPLIAIIMFVRGVVEFSKRKKPDHDPQA